MKIINAHAHLNDDDDIVKKIEHYSHPEIEKTCLIGNLGPLKKALQKYPKFVVPLGLLRGEKITPELADEYYQEGFPALKIIRPERDYDDPFYFPIYEKAEERQMPILFHTGFLAISPEEERGKPFGMGKMRPEKLDTIARAFPDLKIIGAHLGHPWLEEACCVAVKHRNVYFDLSGSSLRAVPLPRYRMLFSYTEKNAAGWVVRDDLPMTEEIAQPDIVRKLLFGSDNKPPAVTLAFCKNLLQKLSLDEETQACVFFKNAAEIFKIKLD
jgi:hypothetical protein